MVAYQHGTEIVATWFILPQRFGLSLFQIYRRIYHEKS